MLKTRRSCRAAIIIIVAACACPSAVLGELLGGAFGINPAQAQPGDSFTSPVIDPRSPHALRDADDLRSRAEFQAPIPPLPQRNPRFNQVPEPGGVVEFMEQNGIPFTDGGIESAIRTMSQRQGLTPSQDVIDESIFGPVGGAAGQLDPGGSFTPPAPLDPRDLDARDLAIQQQVEDDNRDPDRFDNVPAGAAGGAEIPVDAIINFAEQNNIPLTDGGIHEAARAVMGAAYNFDLIESGIRGGANPQ